MNNEINEARGRRPQATGVALYRQPVRPLPLFAWGRLRDEAFAEQLLGHAVRYREAILREAAAVELDDSGEAVLVAAPHAQVEGLLIINLLPADYDRLDAYSGVGEGLYRRAERWAGDRGSEESQLIEVYVYLAEDKLLR